MPVDAKKPTVLAVIPARYGSTRLEGKPLRLIGGRPMIELVCERARRITTADRVIVATDDERIADAVRKVGGEAEMTSPDHRSGTDRVAEVARRNEADIVINLQGDEPFINPAAVDRAVEALLNAPDVNVSTLCVAIKPEQAADPNVTLVVRDLAGKALYFSKAQLPNDRETGAAGRPCYKHLGIYVFRRDFLLKYAALEPTPLEICEKLEQLRILEHGESVLVVETESDSIGVDSAEDLEKANTLIAKG